TSDLGRVERHWKREYQTENGHGERDGQRAQRHASVSLVGESGLDVVQRERVNELAGERVLLPERRRKQQRQCGQINDNEPQQWRRKQSGEPKVAVPVEEGRYPVHRSVRPTTGVALY